MNKENEPTSKKIKAEDFTLDFTFIKKELGDDEIIISKFVFLFNELLEEFHRLMIIAIKKKDFGAARYASHKLAPSCEILGLKSLQKIIIEIETIGINKRDFNKIIDLFEVVILYIEKIKPQIKKVLK